MVIILILLENVNVSLLVDWFFIIQLTELLQQLCQVGCGQGGGLEGEQQPVRLGLPNKVELIGYLSIHMFKVVSRATIAVSSIAYKGFVFQHKVIFVCTQE